jgi:RNA polymerase sigma-70 factor (ECF subfamily)
MGVPIWLSACSWTYASSAAHESNGTSASADRPGPGEAAVSSGVVVEGGALDDVVDAGAGDSGGLVALEDAGDRSPPAELVAPARVVATVDDGSMARSAGSEHAARTTVVTTRVSARRRIGFGRIAASFVHPFMTHGRSGVGRPRSTVRDVTPWRAPGLPASAVEGSFEQAFTTLLPFAFNVGWRFFHGNRQAAEDVAQETMTRAFLKWPKVRAHPKPEAWVTVTALHVALEMGRQAHRAERVPVGLVPAETEGDESRVVAVDEMSRALRRLSERQRQVLVWRYYFDASVAETAEVLGLTESKVKDATHEATTKLAKMMRNERGR